LFDLAIAELRALNRVEEPCFDGRNAAQAREPLWGDSADCSPRALELVDLGDQREDSGVMRTAVRSNGSAIFSSIPSNQLARATSICLFISIQFVALDPGPLRHIYSL